jgi:hypothetical protein
MEDKNRLSNPLPPVNRHGISEDEWRRIAYYAYQETYEAEHQTKKDFEERYMLSFNLQDYQWFYRMWYKEQQKSASRAASMAINPSDPLDNSINCLAEKSIRGAFANYRPEEDEY